MRTGRPALALLPIAVLLAFPGPAAAAVAAPARQAPAAPDIPEFRPTDNPSSCYQSAVTVSKKAAWAQQRLDTKRVWQLTQGENVTVAVIDSGVDGRHPQLAGRVLPGVDVVHNHGHADTDCLGHGTFVAGIIGAAPVNGTPFAGIAPKARILPLRQNDLGAGGSAGGIAQSIMDAIDGGARVINISVATDTAADVLAAAVDEAERNDVLIVASVGNDATNGNPTYYPAAFPNVLGVGAVDDTGTRAAFSENGSYVDLVAPGVNVTSTGPNGDGHFYGNGTSFAAPYVAGVAALVRAYRPELTAAQVRHRLEATADRPARQLPDPEYGWGEVNPYAAVTAVLPEEEGIAGTAPARAVVVAARAPRPAFTRGQRVALASAGLGTLLVAGSLAGRALVVRGRRQRWRPAGAAPTTLKTGAP